LGCCVRAVYKRGTHYVGLPQERIPFQLELSGHSENG
jgi:hypothetical protein